MGIIDNVKSFMGGHGVTVRHTAIEDKPPAEAALAVADGGLKATFVVVAEKPCTVLAYKAELMMEIAHADGHLEQLVIGQDERPSANVERPEPVKYPYDLEAEQEVTDTLDIVFDGSIEALLAQREIVAGSGVRFVLRTVVDVKGSPFDPEAVDDVAFTR